MKHKKSNMFVAIAVIALVFVLAGCTQESAGNVAQSAVQGEKTAQTESASTKDPAQTPEETMTYTLAEVGTHAEKGDCWAAINGKVYDLSNALGTHPGGEAMLEGCGIDATELFETRPMGSGTPHSEKARNYLSNYYIGELNAD